MSFLYLKAVHIVFVVTWFAGLFYMPRLLIYMIEAHQAGEPDKSILLKQLKTMASRLWYAITWPSALITLVMGVSLLVENPAWLENGFMHVKLALVAGLYGYHWSIHVLNSQLQRDVVKYTSQQLRFWNEVATLFLISIVFIIVLKDALSMIWGIVGLLMITFLITMGIRLYKKHRK